MAPTSARSRGRTCASSRTTTSTWFLAAARTPDVYGYVANLATLFDIRTPRGATELRPRVKLQEFPDRPDLEKFEWFLDMHSDYKSERNRFLFDGNASRQDLYNSETPSGNDPGGGDNGDSGQIVVGEVRTWLSVKPTFEHRFTERTSAGIGARIRGRSI